jgi:hypothetical protein
MMMYELYFAHSETPQEAMETAKQPWFLRQHIKTGLLNLEVIEEGAPDPEAYDYAAEYLADQTDLNFTPANVEWLSQMYPEVRATMMSRGPGDSVLREHLIQMVTHFFLRTTWPTYGDKMDVDEFTERLHESAEYLNSHHRQHCKEDGKPIREDFPTPLKGRSPFLRHSSPCEQAAG